MTSTLNDDTATYQTRVVVTGIGVVCAGAADAQEFWTNVQAGKRVVSTVVGVDLAQAECRTGGQIHDLPTVVPSRPDDRNLQLLITAVDAALDGGTLNGLDPSRVGLSFGQCQGSLDAMGSTPFLHDGADFVAGHLGITGPRTVISTACTAGAAALALGAERIATGAVDMMICGGVDVISGFTWAGFSSLQALSADVCAAYSRSSGLQLGEGAGVLILESAESAEKHGRTPIAELAGWGFSADAYHITAPDPTGNGPLLAMSRALDRAGFDLDDVDYLCGHGTGTAANDAMERKVLRLAFGDRAPSVPMSSIKPMIGHTLGAAGAIEAAATVFALRDGVLPPTVNFDTEALDPKFADLDFVANTSRPADLKVVMSNNYAFGGNNSSLVFVKPGGAAARPVPTPEPVVITGIGAIGSIGSGLDEWQDALLAGTSGLAPITGFDAAELGFEYGGEMPELSPKGVTTPAEWRHLDPLSRAALTVARQAWASAKLKVTGAAKNDVAVIFATATGPLSAIQRFQTSVDAEDPSPAHFPNTVFTAAPGHVCKALGVRGPTMTFTSGGVSAVHAIEYASKLVGTGEAAVAIVIAADELHPSQLSANGEQRGWVQAEKLIAFDRSSTGTNLGSAAVAMVIERSTDAQARQAPILARVLATGLAGDAAGLAMPHPRGTEWSGLLARTLVKAGVTADEVGYVAAAANGSPDLDSLETGVIAKGVRPGVTVSAPKSSIGECLGASAAVGVVAGIVALRSGKIPPTANLTDPVGENRVRHVMGSPAAMESDVVLVSAFSIGGAYGAVVLGR